MAKKEAEGGQAKVHYDEEERGLHIVSDSIGSFESYCANSEQNVVEKSPQGRYVRFNIRLWHGAYKEVWKSYDTNEGVEVAWNTLSLKNIPRQDKKRIIHEIRMLEKLDHENIMSFHTSWYNREQKQIIFVTELLNSGSLMEFVKPITLRWKIVKRWSIQILKGLAFLHGQTPPIIHRNINCDNIFIVANRGQLKIGDLGLSTTAIQSNKSENVVGTANFMAPELYEDDNYDEKVDIYAFGMSVLQVIVKEEPYSECESLGQIYRHVIEHIPPAALSRIENQNAKDFIESCIQGQPQLRPSAAELLNHPFLQENEQEDECDVNLLPRLVPHHENKTVPRAASACDLLNCKAGTTQKVQVRLPNCEAKASRNGSDGAPCKYEKLHMRFFSEPPGSISEASDDEGVDEAYIEGIYAHDLPHIPKPEGHDITDEGPVETVSKSPNIVLKEEDRNDDDDLFDDLPEAESCIKKIKVMVGRNTELVEDSPKCLVSPQTTTALPSSLVLPGPSPVITPNKSDTPPKVQSTNSQVQSTNSALSSPAQGVRKLPYLSVSVENPAGVVACPPSPLSSSSTTNLPYNITVVSVSRDVSSNSSLSDSSSPASPFKSPCASPPSTPSSCDSSVRGGERKSSPSKGSVIPGAPKGEQLIAELHKIKSTRESEGPEGSAKPAAKQNTSEKASSLSGSRAATMTFLIKTPMAGKMKEVQFEFNLGTDDPLSVAREMITDLELPEEDFEKIVKTISTLRDKELARRASKQIVRSTRQSEDLKVDPAGVAKPNSYASAVTGSLSLIVRRGSDLSTNMTKSSNDLSGAFKEPARRLSSSGAPEPNMDTKPSQISFVRTNSTGSNSMIRAASEKYLTQPNGGKDLLVGHIRSVTSSDIPRVQSMTSLSLSRASSGQHHELDEDLELVAEVDSDDSFDEEDDGDEDMDKARQEFLKQIQRAKKAYLLRMESLAKCKEDKEDSYRKLMEKHEKQMAEFDKRLLQAEEDQFKRLREMEENWKSIKSHHKEVMRLRRQQAGKA